MTPAPPSAMSPRSASVDTAALPEGHTVFEYRIEKMLGGGGFGITYLARDINLDLPVALKEYFPGDLTSRAADLSVRVRVPEAEQQFHWGLERFLDEARALASFRHANITRVLRYFRENGTAYIVMDYETGDPLKRWLARQTALDQTALLKVIHPLLDGLEAVHKLDFLHRDIKPDNIYIRADGSPVLLDFGAARRTTGLRDLTNIVSPGFAPFEQYHSKGHQGPWSDLYSLGAVMYWMSTGQKPLESAARVQDDAMPRAVDIGDTAVFGEALLRTIDWALSPQVARRPQNVAQLRAALEQVAPRSDGLASMTSHTPVAGSSDPQSQPANPAAAALALPGGNTAALRRNVLGTVLSLMLVASSKYPADRQIALRERFNDLIDKSLKGVAESTRMVMHTEDSVALCFLGDPEEALQTALLLRGLLMQKYGGKLAVRAGLHLGPVRLVMDAQQRATVVGDGINVAQRIMDFAQSNQIVVSRAYHDVISRIMDNATDLFGAMGPHLDKHLRSHEIYAVLDRPPSSPPAAPALSTGFENTASFAALATLTPEAVAEIEADLAHSIGPLAKVLVHKALPRTVSAQGLRELLAVSIPDPAARKLFTQPKSHKTQPILHPASRAAAMPDTLSPIHDTSRPLGDHSQPISSRSMPISALSSPYFSDAQLSQLERALSQCIGPLAKMIVKKEANRHTRLETLLQALAGEIDRPADRAHFLAAMRKL